MTPAWQRLTRVLAAAALMLGASVPAALAQAACRADVPAGWSAAGTRWEGSCVGGRAHGRGLLKETRDGRVARTFFGRAHRGAITLGVIDDGQGYQAGRFAGGTLQTSDDRQVFIDAFREAQQAASDASRGYAARGNGASAALYRDRAQRLRRQMD